jgi:hypothetical protein
VAALTGIETLPNHSLYFSVLHHNVRDATRAAIEMLSEHADTPQGAEDPKWLTGREAAEIIGIAPGNVTRASKEGKIETNNKDGDARRYLRISVDAYAAKRNKKTKGAAEKAETDAVVERKVKRAGM